MMSGPGLPSLMALNRWSASAMDRGLETVLGLHRVAQRIAVKIIQHMYDGG